MNTLKKKGIIKIIVLSMVVGLPLLLVIYFVLPTIVYYRDGGGKGKCNRYEMFAKTIVPSNYKLGSTTCDDGIGDSGPSVSQKYFIVSTRQQILKDLTHQLQRYGYSGFASDPNFWQFENFTTSSQWPDLTKYPEYVQVVFENSDGSYIQNSPPLNNVSRIEINWISY